MDNGFLSYKDARLLSSEIIDNYKSGKTVKYITTKYKIYSHDIYKILKENNIPLRYIKTNKKESSNNSTRDIYALIFFEQVKDKHAFLEKILMDNEDTFNLVFVDEKTCWFKGNTGFKPYLDSLPIENNIGVTYKNSEAFPNPAFLDPYNFSRVSKLDQYSEIDFLISHTFPMCIDKYPHAIYFGHCKR